MIFCCIALGTVSSHIMLIMESNVKKECVCVCVRNWVTLPYSRKLMAHYKPTVMEKIKSIFKKRTGA